MEEMAVAMVTDGRYAHPSVQLHQVLFDLSVTEDILINPS